MNAHGVCCSKKAALPHYSHDSHFFCREWPVLHCFQEEEDAGKAESEETTVNASGDKVTAAKHIIE